MIQRAIRGNSRVLSGEEAEYNVCCRKMVEEVLEFIKIVRPGMRSLKYSRGKMVAARTRGVRIFIIPS